ncbi:glycosyltransferase family 4 protein [Lacrimispora sp.]|uniref:glycosyltransferase family 4 protein n=1 Tax=Lacrimispora sp. TaxID=2719234 RepID=UPI0034600402
MKILYLTNIPSPYRVDFFNELGKSCELTVLFERECAGDRDKKWKSDLFKGFKAIFLKGKEIGVDASICPEIIRYLKKDYDAVILGGYSSPTYMLAMEYMKICKIPFFLNADGGFIKQDSWLFYKIKKHYIGRASAWLSTGKETETYLLHYGAQKKYIYHYPFTSVFEKELYYPTEEEKLRIKEELGISEKRVAITVGQFIPRKGFELLIQAAGKMCKDLGVLIIGGTPNEEYLKLQVEQKAFNVHFLDFMGRDQLKEYYLAADIFVFPTREDIWGLVLNEAMSFGLPCVASIKANASFELVEDGECGYLVDPEEIGDLASKMELLLTDDLLRTQMGRKAFEKIKDYTIEKMAKCHITIIEEWKKDIRGGT